jgi:hypothetical protein
VRVSTLQHFDETLLADDRASQPANKAPQRLDNMLILSSNSAGITSAAKIGNLSINDGLFLI